MDTIQGECNNIKSDMSQLNDIFTTIDAIQSPIDEYKALFEKFNPLE